MWLIQKQQLILLEHLTMQQQKILMPKQQMTVQTMHRQTMHRQMTQLRQQLILQRLTLNKKYCSNKINCPENLQKFPGRYII